MSAASVNALLRAFGVTDVVALLAVLARLTPLFLIAPVLSSPMLIPRVRAVIAVGVAIGLTSVAAHGQHLNRAPLAILGMLLVNLVVGFVVAFAVACVFASVQSAGVLGDSLSGFSYGATIDPVNGNQGGAVTNLYSMVGVVLFLAIGGDAWMLRGINATFRTIPVGGSLSALHTGTVVGEAESLVGSVLLGAIEIAAPVIVAVVITDVAFGLVSRVVPQLNVFAVGFPVKVGVTLLIVGASLGLLGNWMSNQLYESVSSAVGVL